MSAEVPGEVVVPIMKVLMIHIDVPLIHPYDT